MTPNLGNLLNTLELVVIFPHEPFFMFYCKLFSEEQNTFLLGFANYQDNEN